MNDHLSLLVCEAYDKGFKPVTKLWAEVCEVCACTRSQFFDAISDKPSDLPSIGEIRREIVRILERTPERKRGTFAAECALLGRGIDDVYRIYLEQHPRSTVSREMFGLAASEPYTEADYSIARAADGILCGIRRGEYR